MIARVNLDEVVPYGFIDREERSRVTHYAKLPNQDWNGMTLYVLCWTGGSRVKGCG
jgi:hypothetical protein